MPRPPKVVVEETEEKKILTPMEQALAHMKEKDNIKEVYNFEKDDDYRVSTGSLKLDIVTGGGITNGVTRLVGVNSGGKTSEALELCRNFFATKPKGRGIFFKAEGRLAEEVKARSGLTFVKDPKDWEEGTVLIYECNVFENVAGIMMKLILNNPSKCNYFFIIDSLDGLVLRDDLEKGIADAYKVAGPQVIGKKLMQRLALPIYKFGHILVFTSQITAQPKIDPYAQVAHRDFAASGGNWALHYPDNIWEFLPRFKDNLILFDPKAKYDQQKNPIIGHNANLIVRKSSNEKNNVRMTYPIKYGRKDGKSVWVEHEIGDIIAVYCMDIKASWMTFKPEVLTELREIDAAVPEKLQGIDKVYDFLESNNKVTRFLFEKFRKTFCQEQLWEGDGDPLADEEGDKVVTE